jgi:hypothetical protein
MVAIAGPWFAKLFGQHALNLPRTALYLAMGSSAALHPLLQLTIVAEKMTFQALQGPRGRNFIQSASA